MTPVLLAAVHLGGSAALVGLGASSLIGCGSARDANDPSGFPRWEGPVRQAFSDDIDPAAVGLSLERPSARADGYLRERAQTADLVARFRVQTVTQKAVGDVETYLLNVQVGNPPIVDSDVSKDSKLFRDPIELVIRPGSPAYAIAKSFNSRLGGMTFIGFVKQFAGDDAPQLHWYLAPDTPEVAAAVQDAIAKQELSGS